MNRLLALAVPVLLLVSCVARMEEDNAADALSPRFTTFHATLEGSGSETKVYADENMKVLWNADDRITVFNQLTYNSQYRFTGEDGDNAGDFELIPPAGLATGNILDNIYAVYPYASGSGNKINNSGNKITLSLPAEQHYKANSFGIGANTMVAVTNNNFLTFKNVGGYLSLRLYGDNVSVSRITLQGNNHEKIAGKADISVGVGVLPSVSMTEEATEKITLVCDPAVTIGTSSSDYTDFWFVLPPTTFTEGFTITVTDAQGGVFQKTTAKPLTVSRSTVEWMNALEVVPSYDNEFVSFADANFKAYCVENFDTNGDGEVSLNEALTVTTINVITDNIESLGGIEYFVNLTTLDCCGSEQSSGILNDLDLSANAALTNLYCNYNQLTVLDVSNNTALTNLECDNNQLTSLDVSNNTALTNFSCGYNQLTAIDVSHNTALTWLACRSNQLTVLDLSNNTALTRLTCDSNQLTAIDVSHNTALTSLDCYFNQLTSLDMSNNTALRTLKCFQNQLTSLDVSHNTALKELECYRNQLTSLDVSHNTALRTLKCFQNQLTSLDVSNNTALKDLYCYDNQLTSLDISNNTALKYFNCGRNQLTSLDVSNNTALTSLSCGSNQLTSLDISNNTALTMLYCGGSQLTSLDVSNNTALKDLRCGSNQLTSLDVSHNMALTDLFCDFNQLTSLDVSNNTALTWLDCTVNPSLTELWLKTGQTISTLSYDSSVTTIKYKGVDDIVQFADANFKAYCVANFDTDGDGEISFIEAQSVSTISVPSGNIVSLQGIESMISLTMLNCSGNQIALLDVSQNTALTYLDCFYNQLTAIDVSNNTSLTWLSCGDNFLTSLDVSNNTVLTNLSCFNNQLTSLNVSHNTALTGLNCEDNQLTSLDVSNNTALTKLSCQDNQLTSLDVSNNTALTTLYCGNNPSLTELWLQTGQTISELSYDSSVTKIKYRGVDDVPVAVDLGLSVKWASWNLGASSPTEGGDYYSWGETLGSKDGKNNFDFYHYKWYQGERREYKGTTALYPEYILKYNFEPTFGTVDNINFLEPEDDAARAKLGGSWRIPTHTEFSELRSNCTWVWTTENGVPGMRITSKVSGYTDKSIFLPAAGNNVSTTPQSVGSLGSYWSSSLDRYTSYSEPFGAMCIYFGESNYFLQASERSCGLSIRAVCE